MMNKKAKGLRVWVLSLVLVIFFSWCILSFIGGFLDTTNPTSEVLQDKYGINSSIHSFDDTMSDFSEKICADPSGGSCGNESLFGQLGSASPSASDYVYLVFKGAFSIPYTMLQVSFNGIISVVGFLFPALGGTGLGEVVSVGISLLISGLLFTAILLIIKTIRTGESER